MKFIRIVTFAIISKKENAYISLLFRMIQNKQHGSNNQFPEFTAV